MTWYDDNQIQEMVDAAIDHRQRVNDHASRTANARQQRSETWYPPPRSAESLFGGGEPYAHIEGGGLLERDEEADRQIYYRERTNMAEKFDDEYY